METDLAYIRARLKPLDAAARKAVAEEIDIHVKTINRLVDRRTQFGRGDTIGKIAIYFRTKEKRKK